MANLERGIKVPFYFGATPTYVDFFLFAHLEWQRHTKLNRLKADLGVDPLAPYAKIIQVDAGIKALESVQACTRPVGIDDYACKDELIAQYRE